MAWLDQHPPVRSQFRDPRRDKPSGLIVVHTAENVMDSLGPDTGAEAVANYIRNRTTAGSYHDLVDSDSVVHLVRYTCEAFHDATGTNPHSFGLSFACRTTSWATMGPARRAGYIDRGARCAAVYARWVKAEYGIDIPPARLSRSQSEAKQPGFISHAARDPARRSDPGQEFPWPMFLARFRELMAIPAPPIKDDDDMAVAVKGKDSPKVYATDWIHKNHVPDQAQLVEMAFAGLRTDQGHPFVVSQETIDAIPDAT